MDASDAPIVPAQARVEHHVQAATAPRQRPLTNEQREVRRALVLDAQALLSRRRARRRVLRTVAR